jgi:phosphate-selective porin
MTPSDPLAGWTGDQVYLRSADNNFVLMPNGRLQIDGYFYKRDTNKMPSPSLLLRRARLEVAGWIGPWVYFTIGGDFALAAPSAADPAPQSWVSATDNFVGLAPWKDLAMLQVGQFDAPFTFENRTADKYFDFMERSITVRSFGIPSNKEVGAMVHGLLPKSVAYYSLGGFNGDGQNFRNVDSHFDLIGRAWIAPFAFADLKGFENITVGGSIWLGKRGPAAGTDSASALRLASQSTQGGLTFLDPAWTITTPSTTPGGMATTTPAELHQQGKLQSFALEVNIPIQHRWGLRWEYVNKQQHLSVDNATKPTALVSLSKAKLKGYSMYGEAWVWVVGDDTILPTPGELPSRLKKFETTAPKDGVMLAVRVDHLDEDVNIDMPPATDPMSGSRKVTAFAFGTNYWHSKRFRASFNYVLNVLEGDAKQIADARTKAGGKTEHEFLFRLGIAL